VRMMPSRTGLMGRELGWLLGGGLSMVAGFVIRGWRAEIC
jgi:hypothetical protein